MRTRIAVVFLLVTCACASTKMTKAWVYPERGPLQFESVMALVLVQDSLIRRNGEDVLVEEIRQADAVASYTLLPESDLADEDKVRAAVVKSGVEAIIVMRPMYDECGRRVRGQHPLLISKAFEVGTVHFGPRLLAFAGVPEDDLRGVVRQDPPGIRADAGFPRGRAPHCVVPCSVLPGVPSPPEMPWWRRCGPAPSSTADLLWVFTLRETVYEILPGRGFEQAASVLGKTTRAPSG